MAGAGWLWLVLDVGSSGVKAALMDDGGGIVITADAPYSTFSAEGGVVEQDADAWWKAVIDACHHLGHDRAKLGAVNVTGQMQDLVMLDAAGAPVHPVILYSDTR
ncbi:carbohydrate kinase, partial [Anaerolineae bacterium CFX4]|nr:carbohydrate kinase [Anaerolineae bacterium CFX4]